MKNLLSETTYAAFHNWSWHNTASKAFWDACRSIKLNSHGKTLKTVLNGLGVYRGFRFKKNSDEGAWLFRINQYDSSNVENTRLVTEYHLNILKKAMDAIGVPCYVSEVKIKKEDETICLWGLEVCVELCHVTDIERIRAKKAAEKENTNA